MSNDLNGIPMAVTHSSDVPFWSATQCGEDYGRPVAEVEEDVPLRLPAVTYIGPGVDTRPVAVQDPEWSA